MSQLTLAKAKEIYKKHITDPYLFVHAECVSAAMGAMADYFKVSPEEKAHWEAIGYIHDVDFEQYPHEHCHHVREFLAPEGVDEEDIKTIISHGYDICTDEVAPTTLLEKSLYAVDEITGIVHAYALMRPEGLTGMTVKSFKKKFKDKHFAAGCSRDVINKGIALLGLEPSIVMEQVIKGMTDHKDDILALEKK